MTADGAVKVIKDAIWAYWEPTTLEMPPDSMSLAEKAHFAGERAAQMSRLMDRAGTDRAYWDLQRFLDFWRLVQKVYTIADHQVGLLNDPGDPPSYGLNPDLSNWVDSLKLL